MNSGRKGFDKLEQRTKSATSMDTNEGKLIEIYESFLPFNVRQYLNNKIAKVSILILLHLNRNQLERPYILLCVLL
jgi:hypothetical protein